MPSYIGFIGLGLMGSAMAQNMLRASAPLMVWNRTAEKCLPLCEKGATQADTLDALFAASRTVFMMLYDHTAIDEVLARDTAAFARRVSDHIIVNTSTTSAEYSLALAEDIAKAGGRYVEAPVSGSRQIAEKGALLGLLAGEREAVLEVERLLAPVCYKTIKCGAPPSALQMKLAVNIFLISLVTGLAEAVAFAETCALDIDVFRTVLDESPMASDVSRAKTQKLVTGDFAPQAAIRDVLKNNDLILEAAKLCNAPVPLMQICRSLYADMLAAGKGAQDMAVVIEAIRRHEIS